MEDTIKIYGDQSQRPEILVHYMPWYEAPPIGSQFGWHWHMGHFEPYKMNDRSVPSIASQFMPLTGPYDSSDPDILEYQSLLMIMSGIDGVIIDWYGIKDVMDYGSIHKSSRRLFSEMERAGLKFAVCYEDQTIGKMIEGKNISHSDAVPHGREVFQWLENNWFESDAYLKRDGRPLLLNFGPQFFNRYSQWEQILEAMDPRPLLITLDKHMERDSDGTYPWPPMYESVGGVLSLQKVMAYLNSYYKENSEREYSVATAFPGFHDIYSEAGVGNSYGFLDSYGGSTFSLTLKAAESSASSIIQIATWNDYGEGTNIEPTMETGYEFLEQLQDLRKKSDPSFPYNYQDLRIPLQFYRLRRDSKGEKVAGAALDELYSSIISGDRDLYKLKIRELGFKRNLAVEHAVSVENLSFQVIPGRLRIGESISHWIVKQEIRGMSLLLYQIMSLMEVRTPTGKELRISFPMILSLISAGLFLSKGFF